MGEYRRSNIIGNRRNFLKGAGLLGLGFAIQGILPKLAYGASNSQLEKSVQNVIIGQNSGLSELGCVPTLEDKVRQQLLDQNMLVITKDVNKKIGSPLEVNLVEQVHILDSKGKRPVFDTKNIWLMYQLLSRDFVDPLKYNGVQVFTPRDNQTLPYRLFTHSNALLEFSERSEMRPEMATGIDELELKYTESPLITENGDHSKYKGIKLPSYSDNRLPSGLAAKVEAFRLHLSDRNLHRKDFRRDLQKGRNITEEEFRTIFENGSKDYTNILLAMASPEGFHYDSLALLQVPRVHTKDLFGAQNRIIFPSVDINLVYNLTVLQTPFAYVDISIGRENKMQETTRGALSANSSSEKEGAKSPTASTPSSAGNSVGPGGKKK